MRKLMMLAAMLAVVMVAAVPALAQEVPPVAADATKEDEPVAKAGDADAKIEGGIAEANAGGVVAKAKVDEKAPPPPPKVVVAPPPPATVVVPAPAPAPAPAPKAEAPKEEKKELPKTGGNTASLFALGAGALLVAGGLVARRTFR